MDLSVVSAAIHSAVLSILPSTHVPIGKKGEKRKETTSPCFVVSVSGSLTVPTETGMTPTHKVGRMTNVLPTAMNVSTMSRSTPMGVASHGEKSLCW